MAESVSLSPMPNSATETVSFSLTIGIASSSSRRWIVFWKFSCRTGSAISSAVSRICATVWRYSVGIHQLTLTDCGGSLLGRYICRPLSEAELAHAHADRAGGDEDHLISGILEVAEHLAERFHLADVQPAGWMRDGGGADFNDNAHTGVPSSVSCCVEV